MHTLLQREFCLPNTTDWRYIPDPHLSLLRGYGYAKLITICSQINGKNVCQFPTIQIRMVKETSMLWFKAYWEGPEVDIKIKLHANSKVK